MTYTPPPDLRDELSEAIIDTLDIDWQPGWAADAVLPIIERVVNEALHVAAMGELIASTADEYAPDAVLTVLAKRHPVGTPVRKISGPQWDGVVCGYYSSTFTPEGLVIECTAPGATGQVHVEPAKRMEIVERVDAPKPATLPDADGWIPWSGGECPVADGVRVKIKLRNGDVFGTSEASRIYWTRSRILPHFDIIAYREIPDGR